MLSFKNIPFLFFVKEFINVVQGDKNGSVIASGELTIVGLPNEFF